jgi:hypothetical protein
MFCTTVALGMLEIHFSFVPNIREVILLNIVQVTVARLDYVGIAMLMTLHIASDSVTYAT